MVTIHSQGVTEILTLYRTTKFDFPPRFPAQLSNDVEHYGVKSGRFSWERPFSPKKCLKKGGGDESG